MPEREVTPTHSAFLELKEERVGMQEGYSFLDEKRLILASEILTELQRYETDMASFRAAYAEAARALQAAVARHGLEGLELYPAAPALGGQMLLAPRSVIGVIVHEISCQVGEQEPPPPAVESSPEAEHCRAAFRVLVPTAARLAALAGNLERLRLEYTRTARRARALEDVLLPEIDETLKAIDTALEELEREEAIRVRQVNTQA
ncbi:MAG: V-type ATP synthase subunit D [Pseudomonadota bacterium]|nr:V-type ATP synthase subunit D [Pseudomonadota bacterium]